MRFLYVAKMRRLCQGEEHNFFAGYGANVVVQAQHFGAGDLLDHRFHDRPGRFDQMGPYLFEQVSSFLSWERLDQLLFGRRQDTLEADHEQITDQVGAKVLGSPAHVFPFEARHPFADSGFDFSLCFHGGLEHGRIPSRKPARALARTGRQNGTHCSRGNWKTQYQGVGVRVGPS